MHFASFATLSPLAGLSVPCDSTCFSFSGRRSFTAGTPSITRCVAFFVGNACDGQRFNFTGQHGQCTNVNTGTAINSFRCFAGAGC
ncbi:hypothetical protein AURDEDRAFT_166567 [Auricularia subglabra TFB-10046 SS5]|nr:hypothetical protein AURDEDRAFT_166567 [Auricularia subglabra TFB-10046 SS5]